MLRGRILALSVRAGSDHRCGDSGKRCPGADRGAADVAARSNGNGRHDPSGGASRDAGSWRGRAGALLRRRSAARRGCGWAALRDRVGGRKPVRATRDSGRRGGWAGQRRPRCRLPGAARCVGAVPRGVRAGGSHRDRSQPGARSQRWRQTTSPCSRTVWPRRSISCNCRRCRRNSRSWWTAARAWPAGSTWFAPPPAV